MTLTAFTRLGLYGLLSWSLLAPLHAESLPEPLTFEAALDSAANPEHFELQQIEQQLQALRAELGVKQGEYGISVDFIGRLREVGVSDMALPDDDEGDNAASLIVSKPLYDFGLQNSREDHLALQLQVVEYQKQLLLKQRRLEIMEKYFAVLNADNDFISENEALAIGFIRYDNAVEDQALGHVAEIEVLRLQSAYELIRQKRTLAMHQQRLTRAMLAEAMGYPGQLSSDLEIPSIDTGRSLPDDVKAMIARAFTHSAEAQLANARTRAAHAAIGIADASNNPSLDLELEVSRYERESRLRDDWRASLYFEIPIYSAASSDKVDLAQANHRIALADEQQMQSHLRLEVLELWQQVQQLQLKIQGQIIEQDYRDIYLDRSRAEYELEFKSDLGDSMVLYSRSNSQRLASLYAYELAYQRLVALLGQDFINQPPPSQ